MDTPDPRKRPLQSVPDGLRDRLSPPDRREVADLGATLDRRQRDRQRGAGPVPPFLNAPESEAPGAARLWMALDARGAVPVETLPDVGLSVGLGAASVASALDALARAELVRDTPGGVRAIPPGSVPF